MSRKLNNFAILFFVAAVIAVVAVSFCASDTAFAADGVTYLVVDVGVTGGVSEYTGNPVTVTPTFWISSDKTEWQAATAITSAKYNVRYFTSAGAALTEAPSDVGSYYARVYLNYTTDEYVALTPGGEISSVNNTVPLAQYEYRIIPYQFSVEFSLYNDYNSASVYAVGAIVRKDNAYWQCVNAIGTAKEWDSADWNSIAVSEVSRVSTGDNLYSQLNAKVFVGGTQLVKGVDYSTEVYYESETTPTTTVNTAGTYTFNVKMINGFAKAGVAAGQVFSRTFDIVFQPVYANLTQNSFLYNGSAVSLSLNAASNGSGGTNLYGYLSTHCTVNYYEVLSYPAYSEEVSYTVGSTVSRNSNNWYCRIDSPKGKWNAARWQLIAPAYRSLTAAPSQVGNYIYRITINSTDGLYGIAAGDYIDLPFEIKAKPYTVVYKTGNYQLNAANQYSVKAELSDGAPIKRVIEPYFYKEDGTLLNVSSSAYTVTYSQYTVSNTDDATFAPLGTAPSVSGRYKVTVTLNSAIAVTSSYSIPSGTVIAQEFQIVNSAEYGNLSSVYYYTGNAVNVIPSISYGTATCNANNYVVFYFVGGSWTREKPVNIGSYVACITFAQNWTVSGTLIAKGINVSSEVLASADFDDFATADKYYFRFDLVYSNPAVTLSVNNDAEDISFKVGNVLLSEVNSYSVPAVINNSVYAETDILPVFYKNGTVSNIASDAYSISYYQYSPVNDQFVSMEIGKKPSAIGRYKAVITFNQTVTYSSYSVLKGSVYSREFRIINEASYEGFELSYTHSGSAVSFTPVVSYNGTECDSSKYYLFYYSAGAWTRTAPDAIGDYVGCLVFNSVWTVNTHTVANGISPANPDTAAFADFGASDRYYFDFSIVSADPAVETSLKAMQSSSYTDYTISYYYVDNGIYCSRSELKSSSPLGNYLVVAKATADHGDMGILDGTQFYYQYKKTASAGIENIVILSPNADYDGNYKRVTVDFGGFTALAERSDYFINYYTASGLIGYPLQPGTYTAVMSFVNDVPYYGISAGESKTLTFTINPMVFEAIFTADDDLVYDKEVKTYTVRFKANSRPVADIVGGVDYTLMYKQATEGLDAYTASNAAVIAADNYTVAAAFNKSYPKYGIFYTDDSALTSGELVEHSFTIARLSLNVTVNIPVEEKAMYRVESKGGVQPTYVYKKANNGANVVVSNLTDTDFSLNYYAGSGDGYEVTAYAKPQTAGEKYATNRYMAKLAVTNPNLSVNTVSAVCDGAHANTQYDAKLYFAVKADNGVNTSFVISPLPLVTVLDFEGNTTDTLYADANVKSITHYGFYTVDPDKIAKGFELTAAAVTAQNVTDGKIVNVSDQFGVVYGADGDNIASALFDVQFYERLTDTTIIKNGEITPPSAAGSYTVRLVFDKTADSAQFVYSCYSIAGSFDSETRAVANGVKINSNDYFDTSYSIVEPDELRIVLTKPVSFAEGKDAAFAQYGFSRSLSFYFGASTLITLTQDVDYSIEYRYAAGGTISHEPTNRFKVDDQADGDSKDGSSSYRMIITFIRDLPQFMLSTTEGTYTRNPASTVLSISNGDTYEYVFTVFTPSVLQWDFKLQADNLNYNGLAKEYSVNFYTTVNSVKSYVDLIYNSDYMLNYYVGKKIERIQETIYNFTLLNSAPVVPCAADEIYMVEVVFLRNLNEYLSNNNTFIAAYNDPSSERRIMDTNGLISLEQKNSGRYINGGNGFVIQKGKLVITGITAVGKAFDNSLKAELSGQPVLTVMTDSEGVGLGAMVMADGKAKYTFEGTLSATFAKVSKGKNIGVSVSFTDENGADGISGDGGKYYELTCPTLKADITERVITVTPSAKPVQYNPFADEDDNLGYALSNEDKKVLKTIAALSEDATDSELFTAVFNGKLVREKGSDGLGKAVGSYLIKQGTLSFSDSDFTLADGIAAKLEDNVSFVLATAYYDIVKRGLTIGVERGQGKVYGDSDQPLRTYIVSGELIFGDSYNCTPTRAAGENAGSYAITVGTVVIKDSQGYDVTSNYDLTVSNGNYAISKKVITIAIKSLNWKYDGSDLDALSASLVNNPDVITVKDASDRTIYLSNYIVANQVGSSTVGTYYVKSGNTFTAVTLPGDYAPRTTYYTVNNGNHLAGKLGLTDVTSTLTETESVYVRKYRITPGSLNIRDSANLDVTSNYDITYTYASQGQSYYYISKQAIRFKIAADADLEAVYGESLAAVKLELVTNLGEYQWSGSAGVYYTEGTEKIFVPNGTILNVGTYGLAADNAGNTIKILNDKKDITEYFTINVDVLTAQDSQTVELVYTVSKRDVIVTIYEEDINRVGTDVTPRVRYMADEISELSDAIVALLKGTYGFAANTAFIEGYNTVTPQLLSTSNDESNFNVSYQSGMINVIYPENKLTVTKDESGEIYRDSDLVLGSYPLFTVGKTVIPMLAVFNVKSVYEINSDADGVQPSRPISVTITAPEELNGKSVYILAFYGDGSMASVKKATVKDNKLTFEDSRFKYISLVTLEIWPFCVVALVIVMVIALIIVLCVRSAKRRKKLQEIKQLTGGIDIDDKAPTDGAAGETSEDANGTDEEIQEVTEDAQGNGSEEGGSADSAELTETAQEDNTIGITAGGASESDDIIITKSSRSFGEEGGASTATAKATESQESSDDDEIIIRKTSRSFDDDRNDGEGGGNDMM